MSYVGYATSVHPKTDQLEEKKLNGLSREVERQKELKERNTTYPIHRCESFMNELEFDLPIKFCPYEVRCMMLKHETYSFSAVDLSALLQNCKLPQSLTSSACAVDWITSCCFLGSGRLRSLDGSLVRSNWGKGMQVWVSEDVGVITSLQYL